MISCSSHPIFSQLVISETASLSLLVDYSIDSVVPLPVMAVYIVEMSFYLNSLHTTVFVDQWRKDSLVMIAHHIVSLNLLFLTLTIR